MKFIINSSFLIFLCAFFYIKPYPFTFDSRSSTLQVNSGATIFLDSAITDFDGTLRKLTSGTILGQQVAFEKGIFEDLDSELLITGVFDPVGRLLLSGNDFIQAEFGFVVQDVLVSGENNTFSGKPIFSSDVVLQDNATVLNLALQSNVSTNMLLNGGTINLQNDLSFCGAMILTGSGSVCGNGYKVITGDKPFIWDADLLFKNCANVEIHTCVDLTGSLTFDNVSTLNGHGNILDISRGGSIKIDPGSTLYLTDVTLKGLGSGGGSLILVMQHQLFL